MNLDDLRNDAMISITYAPLVLFAIDSSSNSGKRSSSRAMRDIFERLSSHNSVVVFDASSSTEIVEAVKTTSAAYVSHATELTAVDLFKCLDETVGPYNSTGTPQPSATSCVNAPTQHGRPKVRWRPNTKVGWCARHTKWRSSPWLTMSEIMKTIASERR